MVDNSIYLTYGCDTWHGGIGQKDGKKIGNMGFYLQNKVHLDAESWTMVIVGLEIWFQFVWFRVSGLLILLESQSEHEEETSAQQIPNHRHTRLEAF